ncbi:MAG: CxxxxCH/CxxCH domain-containing protein [bacterium]
MEPALARVAVLAVLAVALLMGACGEVEPLDGRESTTHPAGFAEASGHAALLRSQGDDLTPCYGCHQVDEGPGACRACHEQGPEACDVCHRAPTGSHLRHADFACATCHAVPAALRAPGHLADRGDDDVRFAGLATARGHGPAYTGGTCTDTACHAGPEAQVPAPVWEGGLEAPACQACHALPPSGHPQDRCDRCHAPVVDADGRLQDAALHLDGEVQARDWRALGCDACHGKDGNPAPPRDLAGHEASSFRGVGAHAAHLAPASSAPVACETCHVVPRRVDVPGHVDDDSPGVAEVVLAAAAGPDATYADGRCADTRCHGGATPAWTGTAPCGSCHGLPPADHPAGDCARCHPSAGPGRTIADASQHLDGRLDIDAVQDCQACHAAGARAAPAGSHAAHARFECATCHAVPTPPLAAHLDGRSPVTLMPGRFEAGTCAETACHGSGTPTWGRPETGTGCDACHGNPPAPHPVGTCDQCHPAADDPRHVNGVVDRVFAPGCDGCHGLPPATGAHLGHTTPQWGRPAACEDCHVVPRDVADPGHLDAAPAEVRLAAGGAFDGATCTDSPCHARPGAQTPAPAWAGPPQRCGDCHGVPPPRHLRGECGLCHPAVAEGYDIHTPARHGDGRVDFR